MTIEIKAYQKHGKISDKLEDEFKFCCWDDLYKWLKKFHKLHKCDECKKEK